MLVFLIVFLLWFVCGAFAFALTLGDFDRKHPDMSHGLVAEFAAAAGPFGLFAALGFSERPYVMRWVKRSYAEREKLYAEKYPALYARAGMPKNW